MLLFTVALAISLVGYFAYTPINIKRDAQQPAESSEIERLLDRCRQLEQALKVQPDSVEMQAELGRIRSEAGIYYASLGDYSRGEKYFKAAIEPYQKALEIDPDRAYLRVDLATAAFYGNLDDLAEEQFQKAIQQDPELFSARYNYGFFLYERKNDFQGAIEQWEAARELSSDPQVQEFLESLIASAREQAE
jgi:Tfp pilus assembly protein PilF